MITIRSLEELIKLEEASRVVLETLDVVEKAVAPGVTTDDLDQIAEGEIRKRGARPAFVGYRGYPKTLCTSINEEVVHGIPKPTRILREGDIVSLDIGARIGGTLGRLFKGGAQQAIQHARPKAHMRCPADICNG